MQRVDHLFTRGLLAACLIVAIVLALIWQQIKIQPLNTYDQPFYLGIAYDIRHEHTFTDGYVFSTSAEGERRPPGMRFAPFYPALLAAAAALDQEFAVALDCVGASHGRDAGCPRASSLVRGLQLAMVAGIYVLTWVLCRWILQCTRSAWIGLALALFTVPTILRYSGYLMTEVSSVFWFVCATAALVRAIQRGSKGCGLGAGILFGLAALTRPAFLYGGVATAALGVALVAFSSDRRRVMSPVLLFAVGLFAALGPWYVRNAIEVGQFGLTHGYDSHTLVQRISFDQMTWHEYGLSYLCWLPDWLKHSADMFGANACVRFGWEERPDTFYMIGNNALMRETVEAAGGWEHHLDYLVKSYLLASPIKHLLVTIPLALRGAWVGGVWGLLLAPLSIRLMVRAARLKRWDALAASLPAWIMLAFNAFVSVNQTRYNLVLIPSFALAGAHLINGLLDKGWPDQDPVRTQNTPLTATI